ncbi:MAG: MauE/DoxX family redox-associated membrane protein [Pseudomonadota bacterium]
MTMNRNKYIGNISKAALGYVSKLLLLLSGFVKHVFCSPEKQNNRIWRYTLVAVRLGLALVYLVAGAGKIMDVQGFAEIIKFYDIMPLTFIPFIAVCLPIVEIVAAIGLIFKRVWALHAITAMTIMFMLVLGFAIWTGLAIGDCGCFAPEDIPQGHDDGSALREAFIRDIGLLAASAILYIARWRHHNS